MEISIAEPFKCLFDENDPNYWSRYLVWYGGRGSGKTVSIAKGLLIRGMKRTERILCAREFQNSISDSVLKTLEDEIDALGLRGFYEVQNNAIYGKNGTEFIFKGLRNNIQSIKSMAGITLVWLEEAQTLSDRSYEILIPTIRAEGSQIMVSFNPDNDDDPTYIRFVVNQPDDAYICKVNYDENPWFPETLRKEMEFIKHRDTDLYNHIWLGETRKNNVGAIYAKWINDIEEQITNVPYNPSFPVITAWDLGIGDSTVIWFCQMVGFEPRIIDCYASNMEGLDHYVKFIKNKNYNYDTHVLPHDAGHKSLRTGTTLAKQLEGMGLNNIKVLPVDSVETGIQLVRQLIPQLWFDKEKCEKGISALRKYQYEFDDERKVFKTKPLHNWCSDYADAMRYLATFLKSRKAEVSYNHEPGTYAYR
jgi:phage terminase large subunit